MKPRILIAGIGNIFLGDDGFGVEVVRRLPPQPEEVRVADFGIRGLDLAFTLEYPYELVILVDALPQGGAPGTVYVMEPDLDDLNAGGAPMVEGHGMDPLEVLRFVQENGASLPNLRIVGCEPGYCGTDEDQAMGLSDPVAAAVPAAIEIIEEMVARTLDLRAMSAAERTS